MQQGQKKEAAQSPHLRSLDCARPHFWRTLCLSQNTEQGENTHAHTHRSHTSANTRSETKTTGNLITTSCYIIQKLPIQLPRFSSKRLTKIIPRLANSKSRLCTSYKASCIELYKFTINQLITIKKVFKQFSRCSVFFKMASRVETPFFAQIWTVFVQFWDSSRSGVEKTEGHKNCNNPFILPTKVQIGLIIHERVKYHKIDLRIFPDLYRSGMRQSEEEKNCDNLHQEP